MGVALGVGAASISGDVDVINRANTTVLANAVAIAVPAATETTITSFLTVSPTWITQVICSGMEYGKFRYFEDLVAKVVERGGADRNCSFNFIQPLKVAAGVTVSIKVTHYVTGETPDFEASIIGYTGT
jgi:uncharacterized membrane protein